jgi:hypothetical protein
LEPAPVSAAIWRRRRATNRPRRLPPFVSRRSFTMSNTDAAAALAAATLALI